MKIRSPRFLLAAFAMVCFVAVAFAGDPTGTWTWSVQRNGQSRTSTLTLALKDGTLTASLSGRNGDTAIGDATFKDDAIAFTVEREFNGNKFVAKYSGKLDGDTIKGSIELPGRDGGDPQTVNWTATRSKAGDAMP